MGTGEKEFVESFFFNTGFELYTIVKLLKVESFVHPDNSMQVYAECKGLDSVGFVFDIDLNFTPESSEERDQLLHYLKVDSFSWVKGAYLVPEDAPITLADPVYHPISADYSEDEIKEAFKVNTKQHSNT